MNDSLVKCAGAMVPQSVADVINSIDYNKFDMSWTEGDAFVVEYGKRHDTKKNPCAPLEVLFSGSFQTDTEMLQAVANFICESGTN